MTHEAPKLQRMLRRVPKTFSRYLLVGIGTSTLDLALFSILAIWGGLHPVLANVVSTVVTVCVSYVFNRTFVFVAETKGLRAFLSFASVTLFTGLVYQSLVVWIVVAVLGTDGLGVSPVVVAPLAKVLAMGSGALMNYVSYRYIFRRRSA